MSAAEDREWRSNLLADVLTDAPLRRRVGFHIGVMRQPGDPQVTPADVQAARNYLEKCMDRMSINELANKDPDDLAALWARGALGAARYRLRGGGSPRRGPRSRSTPEEEE